MSSQHEFCTKNLHKIPKSVLICDIYIECPLNITFKNLQCVSKYEHLTPKVGNFFKIVKIQHFLWPYFAHKISRGMVFPFILNTKQPLRDFRLQTISSIFEKNRKYVIFRKHPKMLCLYLSNQISLKVHFVFKRMGGYSLSVSLAPTSQPSLICQSSLTSITSLGQGYYCICFVSGV